MIQIGDFLLITTINQNRKPCSRQGILVGFEGKFPRVLGESGKIYVSTEPVGSAVRIPDSNLIDSTKKFVRSWRKTNLK